MSNNETEIKDWSIEEMMANPAESLNESYQQMIALAQIAAAAQTEGAIDTDKDLDAAKAEYSWISVRYFLSGYQPDVYGLNDNEQAEFELRNTEIGNLIRDTK